jgi:spore coat protein U-like protein
MVAILASSLAAALALRMAAIKRAAGAQMVRKLALAAVLFLLSASPADAQLSSAVCSMSASGVNFGTTTGEATTAVGNLVLRCTGNGNVSYSIALTTGLSGVYPLRQMGSGGSDRLAYNLYTEASLGTIWGNGSGGSQLVTGRLQFQGQPVLIVVVPVRARLPIQPAPAPGSYQDIILATLSYPGNEVLTEFEVTANESPSCAISATNLSFGDYTQARLDGQSAITLACTHTTPWTVGLSQGTAPGATVTTRKMTGPGGASLPYALFQDAARTVNWGNTVGIDTVRGTGTGDEQTLNVYGRVPASQAVGSGSYQDMIVVTLTF